MHSFAQMHRLSSWVVGGYKSVLHGRSNWINPIQSCSYTKKSAEARLGLDKPKRPLTPFFKFMSQMRPALLAKNPGISSKEAISWSSKHWQELDTETKSQMMREYEKDMEDYKKIKALYESTLTDQQKEDIKNLKEELTEAKEKRKLKAELKDLGKPKKPMSSYLLFAQTKKDTFKGKNLKEYQEQVKKEWDVLPETEKRKFESQAQELMNKYKKDLESWEKKMVAIGRTDVVRTKQPREKKVKSFKKAE